MITVKLPWPPSTNNLYLTTWRKGIAVRVPGKRATAYAKAVGDQVLVQQVPRFQLTGSLVVWLYCRPPDNRSRDLDNLPKAVLDSLVKAGVLPDDSFIDELHIIREQNMPDGEIEVNISELRTHALRRDLLVNAR